MGQCGQLGAQDGTTAELRPHSEAGPFVTVSADRMAVGVTHMCRKTWAAHRCTYVSVDDISPYEQSETMFRHFNW